MPGKPLKWLATGQWYREVVASEGGGVRVYTDRARAPGYVFVAVQGKRYKVPQDAFDRGEINIPNRQSAGMADSGDLRVATVAQGTAKPGEKIWAGYVMAGDHVFVNRMKWNFFPPRRGQIMVFATDDIPNLNPGEHYIKRMAGLPDETIGIEPPYLLADGARVTHPDTILKVAEKRAAWKGGPHYKGYTHTGAKVIGAQTPGGENIICPLGLPGDVIALSGEQYLALGDNTGSSYDSRYWGPVPRKRLVGPASCIYWPWSPRWGGVK
jgi:signal peptidase I